MCALTAWTGLSLSETIVHVAARDGVAGVETLVGPATSFFSYSWTGTKLGDMLDAIERKLEELEAEPGAHTRFVWVDMFCASQPLLAGHFLPPPGPERDALKRDHPEEYKALKEDTGPAPSSRARGAARSPSLSLLMAAGWASAQIGSSTTRSTRFPAVRSSCTLRRWRTSEPPLTHEPSLPVHEASPPLTHEPIL